MASQTSMVHACWDQGLCLYVYMFILVIVLSPKFLIVLGTGWMDDWLRFYFVCGKKCNELLRLFHFWVSLPSSPCLPPAPSMGQRKKIVRSSRCWKWLSTSLYLACIGWIFLPWSQGRLNRTFPTQCILATSGLFVVWFQVFTGWWLPVSPSTSVFGILEKQYALSCWIRHLAH